MNECRNILGIDIHTEGNDATSGPIISRDAPSHTLGRPSRKDWEERMASLRAELEDLDQDIFEGELFADSSHSHLRGSREEILTRIIDLKWLISNSIR